MKEMLVGGGFVDFATLHPLATFAVLLVAVVVVRRAVRTFGAGRQRRGRRPPRGGDGEASRPASGAA